MARKCKCDWCKRYLIFKRVMRFGTKQELRDLLDATFDWSCHVEADLNYAEAVLDGSWPTAVEQLTNALQKAQEIAARERN